MIVGKNKCISKGKKGGKKKTVDPFSKKDRYDIKAPPVFSVRNIGKTLVSRTQGTKIASEGLKHRVFEVSLVDLHSDEDKTYMKIRLCAEDVQGGNVITNFWGMSFTTDKLHSLVKKWHKDSLEDD
uniref:40S ribosomal protein S3a n=1 Tax=Zea mays TaxID=4577 RepID=A0A804MSK4_MAIZE